MTPRRNFMLRATYQKLLAEHDKMKKELQQAIPEQIESSYRSGGEWHDNPGYDAALEKQSHAAKLLAELASLLEAPVFIEDLNIRGDEIRVGVSVTISYSDGTRVSYDILGPADTRYRENVMSCFSPLAQQLLGRKVGEKVSCKVPRGEEDIVIAEIQKIDFLA